ncbi:hypothetical protein ACJ73_03454 [Blastomyces percursus]|uniref:Uncharacterized protein n=1 Tax=Blastomyces percursus TaxID=1658174 RepID=A0A1J9Q9H6_9EURO|nr:hypothetical protein ACJ73_03454 [Blastomyces percursus]
MPPRTRVTAGLLDTPASNVNMEENDEYGQETPTPGPRGDAGRMGPQIEGQVNDYTMIRMMMEYMERQDRRHTKARG